MDICDQILVSLVRIDTDALGNFLGRELIIYVFELNDEKVFVALFNFAADRVFASLKLAQWQIFQEIEPAVQSLVNFFLKVENEIKLT